MRNFKRLAALGMSAVMMAGSVMPVMAANPNDRETEVVDTQGTSTDGTTLTPTEYNVEGSGVIESVVSDTVFKITVPTADALKNILSFAVDPQQLVYKTNGGSYQVNDSEGNPTVEIEEGATVLFRNVETSREEGATTDTYTLVGVSSTSDELVITNMSSKPVEISVACSLIMPSLASGQEGYEGGYSTNPEFANTADVETNRESGLYIGMMATGQVQTNLGLAEGEMQDDDDDATTPEVWVKTGDSVEFANVALGAADAYEYSYNTTDGYKYAIADPEFEFPTYSFQFTGTTNPACDITTWASKKYNATTGQIELTAYAVPHINLVFTPVVVDANRAQAEIYEKEGATASDPAVETLRIQGLAPIEADEEAGIAADGGILGNSIVSVRVNGKDVDASAADFAAGTIEIAKSAILTAYAAEDERLVVNTAAADADPVYELAEGVNMNVVIVEVDTGRTKSVQTGTDESTGDPIMEDVAVTVLYYAEF